MVDAMDCDCLSGSVWKSGCGKHGLFSYLQYMGSTNALFMELGNGLRAVQHVELLEDAL